MKKVFTYLTVAGAALFAAACDPNNAPVFDDSDAFVGFSSTRVTVSESVVKKSGEKTDMGDTVFIPVTLGSVAGLAGSATYTIVPDTTKDGVYPVEGIHYELVDNDGTGTLKFDADNRTRYIGIAGKLYDEYTGNLSLNIKVKASSGLKTGAQDVCTVVITDVNHPLADLIGSWTSTVESAFDYAEYVVTTTMEPDADDVTKIWFTNLQVDVPMKVYGIVSGEKGERVITVPCGQKSVVGGYEFELLWLDTEEAADSDGEVVIAQQVDESLLSEEYGFGVYAYDAETGDELGWYGANLPGGTWVKQ